MRHRVKVNNLSRVKDARVQLLISQANLLFEHNKLVTTTARAKATRNYVNKMLVRAKKLNTNDVKRYLEKNLKSTKKADFVIEKVLPKLSKDKTNYLRLLKLENRKGDNSSMTMLILDTEAETDKAEKSVKAKAKASKAKSAKKETKKTKKAEKKEVKK